jgi:4-hydroxybenzoate polyprenyltransferase
MSDFIRILLLLLLVVSAAVLLCLLVPALSLLELFLVLSGGLILAAGVSTVNDLIDYHKVERELRKIKLEKKRQQLLPSGQNQTGTSHRHDQARLRRLRGGRCR